MIRANKTNEMELIFDSKSENESLARIVVAAFVSNLDPTMEEIADIKTAISEAVTNSVIHGYQNGEGKIRIFGRLENNHIHLEVTDYGVGIEDVEKAREPLYTTRTDMERSGMGFAFMEAFMDHLEVISEVNKGTTVIMEKEITRG